MDKRNNLLQIVLHRFIYTTNTKSDEMIVITYIKCFLKL